MATTARQRPADSPLSQPIHRLTLLPGSPPWRDNAFLLFWDPKADIYGSAHVTTSPNAEGRRARFSLTVAGDTVEIVEALAPNSFASQSLTFVVQNNQVRVRCPKVSADLELAPRFAVADYAASGIFPSVDPDVPIHHYQQGVSVAGEIRLPDKALAIDAHGLRDRTWGYRDESVSIQEYVALVAFFPDHVLTVMRMLAADGSNRMEGYRLTDTAEPLTRFGVTRDAAGFLVEAHLDGTGGEFDVRAVDRRAGFWVPMGTVRRAPAIRAYDEFVALRTSTGDDGFGVVEQAVVHRLF
jgi:hypothetical protein